jgi:hypothetical protein
MTPALVVAVKNSRSVMGSEKKKNARTQPSAGTQWDVLRNLYFDRRK